LDGREDAVRERRVTLADQMERDGVRLFRRRSYTPLIPLALVVAAVVHSPSGPDPWWTTLSILFGLAGIAIRAATIASTPAGTSGRTTGAPMAALLNTTGMYSVVRHPLYVGNFLMWFGVVLFTHAWAIGCIVSLLYWLQYERIALAEERVLRERFGDAFEAWAERVPAFIPALHCWERAALPFSWRAVIGREFTGLYGFLVTLTLLELVRASSFARRLTLSPGWRTTFALATVGYLLALSLRRTTRILHVDGR
jgi:protein-S-isoprenylcysteine O-methyltransferase Ste14